MADEWREDTAATPQKRLRSASGLSARVLLVDDDQHLSALLAEALCAFDYTVITASGAPEALLLLETEAIDVVVTDVIMPVMTGLRLLELITAAHPTLPVIIVSAFLTERITEDALDRGARAVLEKPLQPKKMAQVISEILNKAAD